MSLLTKYQNLKFLPKPLLSTNSSSFSDPSLELELSDPTISYYDVSKAYAEDKEVKISPRGLLRQTLKSQHSHKRSQKGLAGLRSDTLLTAKRPNDPLNGSVYSRTEKESQHETEHLRSLTSHVLANNPNNPWNIPNNPNNPLKNPYHNPYKEAFIQENPTNYLSNKNQDNVSLKSVLSLRPLVNGDHHLSHESPSNPAFKTPSRAQTEEYDTFEHTSSSDAGYKQQQATLDGPLQPSLLSDDRGGVRVDDGLVLVRNGLKAIQASHAEILSLSQPKKPTASNTPSKLSPSQRTSQPRPLAVTVAAHISRADAQHVSDSGAPPLLDMIHDLGPAHTSFKLLNLNKNPYEILKRNKERENRLERERVGSESLNATSQLVNRLKAMNQTLKSRQTVEPE